MLPVLTPTAVDDTTLPGSTRRLVWHAPDVRSHSLVILSATRLFLAPASGPPTHEALAALAAGDEPENVIGADMATIELAKVRRVRHDLLKNTLVLEYGPDASAVDRVSLVLATAETADAVYSKVWRRLGPDVALTPYKPSLLTLVSPPAAVMVGILLATIVLALGASLAGDFSQGSLAFDGLDWRWVCAAGGAALAVAQVWLYRRVTQPPVRLELARR